MTIKIDYDGIDKFDYEEFERNLFKLMKIHNWSQAMYHLYKTRRGFHVYIDYLGKTLEDKDVLICQVLLGSDKEREFFNYGRLINKELDKWNVLFVRKYVGNQLVSEEQEIGKKILYLFEVTNG